MADNCKMTNIKMYKYNLKVSLGIRTFNKY